MGGQQFDMQRGLSSGERRKAVVEDGSYYDRTTCRLCGAVDLEPVLQLAPTPPGNHFLAAEDLGKPEPHYPLELRFCRRCFHIQLGAVVDPSVLYQRNYSYLSGTSPVFVQHFREYAMEMTRTYGIGAGDLVIDLGSNDGTCLRFFQEAGCTVLGIDPARNVAELASGRGIPTIPQFFTHALARSIREEHGPAKLVTSHNACAHIDDLEDVVRGAAHLLAADGLFVFEVGYFVDVFENVWFDTIYHEHLDYHTVAPLRSFLERVGLELRAVQRVSPQGGSIRVTAGLPGGGGADPSVNELCELERHLGLHDSQTLRRFVAYIDAVHDRLSSLVGGLRRGGATIAGYGAPTKATTLLTHFGLGRGVLDFIVDDNPLKQNLYSPGHHIPVLATQEIYEQRPDYVLILAWNFADDIMQRHRIYAEQGGRFILPMPEPRIV
jgi:SAM-dependent methyltransferase